MKEIEHFVAKAEKFLRTAEQILQIGDYDSSVSRCYYAMFYMAQAVPMTKNVTGSSHKGVIRLFGEHFGKPHVFDPQIAKSLSEAYHKRLAGDYAIGAELTQEEANELLVSARKFVGELKNYLQQQIGKEYESDARS